MSAAYFISVYLHILAAIIWTGGMISLALVLLPAVKDHPDRALLIHSVGIRLRTVGWIVLAVLLFTGIYNMQARQIGWNMQELTGTRAGQWVLLKLVFFTVTAVIGLMHDFYIGTKATELWMGKADPAQVTKFRQMARWAGRVNVLLALAAIGCGVALTRGY